MVNSRGVEHLKLMHRRVCEAAGLIKLVFAVRVCFISAEKLDMKGLRRAVVARRRLPVHFNVFMDLCESRSAAMKRGRTVGITVCGADASILTSMNLCEPWSAAEK